MSKEKYLIKLSLPITFLLGSCGAQNLSQVEEFSKLAISAKNNSEVVWRDFYPSCIRTSYYVPIDPLPNTNKPENETGIIVEIDRRPVNLADPLVVRKSNQSLCDKYLPEMGSDFRSVNGVVVNYVATLGLVANPDLTNLDAEFQEIQTSSANLTANATDLFNLNQPIGTRVIPTDQVQGKVSAVLNIFQFITEGILDAKRQEILGETIVKYNDDFQEVIEALRIIVSDYYIKIELKNEENALDGVFQRYINALEQSESFQSGVNVSNNISNLQKLDADWMTEKKTIQQRRDAAQAYIGVLNALSSGHQNLYETFSDGKTPSPQQVQSILDTNTAALKIFITKSQLLNTQDIK